MRIGWDTNENDWLPVGEGGYDCGQGVHRRVQGECGPAMLFEEAVSEVRRIYEDTRHLLRDNGLPNAVEDMLHRRATHEAWANSSSAYNLPLLVKTKIGTWEAEKSEALGVQQQLVWDVESSAQAPLGELKFTPYPIEKQVVEWLDDDDETIGFELQGKTMYFTVLGERYAPRGPAHVVNYKYPASSSRGLVNFSYTDSQGYSGHSPIPPDKHAQVKAMWDIAKTHLKG